MPVLLLRAARLHQHGGHSHPHGHLDGVQHKHPQVQTPQVGLGPHLGHARQTTLRRNGMAHRLGWHHPQHHGNTRQGQRAGQTKQARQTDERSEHGGQHQRQRKHQPDAAAHQRHGLGTHTIAGLVGQQGSDRRRHSPGTLQRAADQQSPQAVGHRSHQAARGKHQQTGHDDPFAAQPVGSDTKRNLQKGLRQAINTHRQPDHGRVVPAGVFARLQRKHRQHQEQAQHTQREDARQREAGAALQRRHGSGTAALWGCRRRRFGGRGRRRGSGKVRHAAHHSKRGQKW